MMLKQTGQERVGRIHVVQEMVRCWELGNVEMTIRYQKETEFPYQLSKKLVIQDCSQ
jgi:hypothetical protein